MLVLPLMVLTVTVYFQRSWCAILNLTPPKAELLKTPLAMPTTETCRVEQSSWASQKASVATRLTPTAAISYFTAIPSRPNHGRVSLSLFGWTCWMLSGAILSLIPSAGATRVGSIILRWTMVECAGFTATNPKQQSSVAQSRETTWNRVRTACHPSIFVWLDASFRCYLVCPVVWGTVMLTLGKVRTFLSIVTWWMRNFGRKTTFPLCLKLLQTVSLVLIEILQFVCQNHGIYNLVSPSFEQPGPGLVFLKPVLLIQELSNSSSRFLG